MFNGNRTTTGRVLRHSSGGQSSAPRCEESGLMPQKSMWGLWEAKGDGAVFQCQLPLGQHSSTHPSSGASTRGCSTKALSLTTRTLQNQTGSQVSAAMQMRSALFSDFTQCRMLTPYRRWPGWPLKMGLIGWTETSVENYHSTLRKILEDCWSQNMMGHTRMT